MKILFTFCFLLSISIGIKCQSDYNYRPRAEAWFKEHKVIANWTEARIQCYREDAVLASPTSEKMLAEILRIIRAKVNQRQSYFIGLHSTFSPGHFVSVEGIPLYKMPVMDMIQRLDPTNGECLSTDGYEITVTSCDTLLPYICYKEKDPNKVLTSCGTFDEAYKYEEVTGSCYKLHKDLITWEQANSICITEGGYLVILNNEKEASLVYDMYPHSIEPKIPGCAREWDPLHIGLRDWGSGVWMSIHGESISKLYNTWHDLEPRAGQLCGALPRKGKKLEGEHCYFKSFFVCEKDPHNVRFNEVNGTQVKK